MGMSPCYGARDETESIATLNRAVDLGTTLIDTRRGRRAIRERKAHLPRTGVPVAIDLYYLHRSHPRVRARMDAMARNGARSSRTATFGQEGKPG
jgi:aryl-alcohol dehydrogenase-like predicted oxidoreductase